MRVLFTTQPGHGHLQPMAPYATALADAGDEVKVATAPSFCPVVESLGLDAVAAGVDFTWENPTKRFPELIGAAAAGTLGAATRTILFEHWVPSFSDDLAALLAGWRPDLIIREAAECAAMFVAQQHGIPCAVAAWGAVSPDPVWELNTVPQSALREEYARRAQVLGLPADADAYWVRELTLSSLPPSWIPDDLDARPPVHHFRMPPLDGGRAAGSWSRQGSRPLVYATLGTVWGFDREMRAMLLEALGELDVDVLMTVGRSADPASVSAPANVRVERYVPQSLVLPDAAAVVSHGGLGTMIGAIAAGVPMVLIDFGADHAVNGARAGELGIATIFKRRAVDAAALRDAVAEILTDPLPRARARALADEYARLPPPAAAVEVLHRFVRDGAELA